jgi:hypothetical protein
MTGIVMGAMGAVGASAPGTVTLGSSYNIVSTGSGVQSASFTLESDGDIISATTPGGSVDEGDWLNPKASAPSLYEVRATVTSGSLSSGTAGSWLALTSNRTWTRLDSSAGDGANVCVLTIEIRYNGGAVLDTSTVTLTAERV